MAVEELQGALEANELRVIDRGEEIKVDQALQQAQVVKKGFYDNKKGRKGKGEACQNWSGDKEKRKMIDAYFSFLHIETM